jgi:hypothetical protein
VAALTRVEPDGRKCAHHRTGRSPADVRESAGVGSSRQRWLLVIGFATAIGTDQAVKWLAWRRLDGSLINNGGYILLGPLIRSWFAGTVSGAIADVGGGAVLVVAVGRLLRRPRPIFALIGGGLVAAGWASNLLDRLGMHNWTARASSR